MHFHLYDYKLIENRLSLKDCKNGYIIDGFPRNLEQAIKYDEILKKVDLELGYVFALNIDKKELEKRKSPFDIVS